LLNRRGGDSFGAWDQITSRSTFSIMRTITSTELARHLRDVLDAVARDGAVVLIERNRKPVAVLQPAPGRQTALQALTDLHRTLPDCAAEGWAEGTRGMLAGEALSPL